MKKYFLFMIIFLCICGCAREEKRIDKEKSLYIIKDCQGSEISFTENPIRVLPISKGLIEITLDLIDPQRIVAVSEESLSDESFVKNKAVKVRRVTSRYPSIETILELQPDLVIVPETMDLAKIKTLREMGIKVVVTIAPKNIIEIKERIIFVAQVLNAEKKGIVILNKMEEKLSAIEEMKRKLTVKNQRKKSLIAFSSNGAFGRAGGLFDNLCQTAGVINGAANSGLQKLDHLSKEQIIRVNPDYFLLPEYAKGSNKAKFIDEVINDPAYQNLKAIKKQQKIILEEKYFKYNVSQYAADAAYLLAASVYHPYLQSVEILNYD